MLEVGFVGIGNMGELMSANLARAGFSLVLCDSDEARAQRHAAAIGARQGGLAEVAACPICVTMLPTSAVVQEVLLRQDHGAYAAAVAEGTIVIDMSSSAPAQTRQTGDLLAAMGVTLIDAPVSGGVARAEAGTLAIMVGSDDPAAVERVRPVLAAMGDRIFAVGKLGAGDVMKAANNYVAAATYAATAEALEMGRTFGLDPAQMIDIINVSTGRSFNSEVVMKDHVITGAFATGFALALLAKDVGIAADLASQTGVDAPLSALVSKRYANAAQAAGTGADNSEAICGWYAGFARKSA